MICELLLLLTELISKGNSCALKGTLWLSLLSLGSSWRIKFFRTSSHDSAFLFSSFPSKDKEESSTFNLIPFCFKSKRFGMNQGNLFKNILKFRTLFICSLHLWPSPTTLVHSHCCGKFLLIWALQFIADLNQQWCGTANLEREIDALFLCPVFYQEIKCFSCPNFRIVVKVPLRSSFERF